MVLLGNLEKVLSDLFRLGSWRSNMTKDMQGDQIFTNSHM